MSTLRQEDGERVVVRVDDVDPAVMLGEPELIKSLFRNLIDNALRYSLSSASVQVRSRLYSQRTQVEIIDQGPGISDAESLRIFDRFYRLDNTRTRATVGFGLGLAIVRAIAATHNADVRFSQDGTVGTLVSVKFCTVYLINR